MMMKKKGLVMKNEDDKVPAVVFEEGNKSWLVVGSSMDEDDASCNQASTRYSVLPKDTKEYRAPPAPPSLSFNNKKKDAPPPPPKSTTTTILPRPQRQQSLSLYVLSLIWLTLCSGLVWKHYQLVTVFYSFCGCWTMSYVLGVLWSSSSRHRRRRSLAAAATIQRCMGTTAALVQLAYVWKGWWSSSQHYDDDQQQHENNNDDATYQALSIASGYLAFDQWYTFVYYNQLQQPQHHRTLLWQIVANATFLTLFLVLLVLWTVRNAFPLSDYINETVFTTLWSLYQLLVPLFLVRDSSSGGGVILLSKDHHHHNKETPSPRAIKPEVVLPPPKKAYWTEANHERKASVDNSSKTLQPQHHVWCIHGETYDLTNYVHSHPGGREAILLGRDRDDCTALFQSYHPFTVETARKVLVKYWISRTAAKAPTGSTKAVTSTTTTTAATTATNDGVAVAQNKDHDHDKFYQLLCQRVEQRLRGLDFDPIRDRAASSARTGYYLFLVVAAVLTGIAHSRGSIVGSFLFAVSGWLLGALGHDAGHFAASRSSWINDVCVWGMSLLCNPILWQHQHTFAHHSHTNSFDHDPDLHHFESLLRVHKRFQHSGIYQYQKNPLFVAFAYTFAVFGTCVWIPWGMVREGSLYGIVQWTDRKRPLRTLALYLHWFAYACLVFVLPFWVHDRPWSAFGAAYVHVATSGLIFAVFSQVNHLNEASLDTDAFRRRRQNRPAWLRTSWAVDQVETSNNFCPHSMFWHFLSNGLNLQIEHHLFPGLNHCHLPLIQPTVEAVCREYGVYYKSYAGWKDLMKDTLSWLDRLSRDEKQRESDICSKRS